MSTHIRRRPFLFRSPFRGRSSPVSSFILTHSSAHSDAVLNLGHEQRRLSCSIGTDHGNPRIQSNVDIDTLEQDLVCAISKIDIG